MRIPNFQKWIYLLRTHFFTISTDKSRHFFPTGGSVHRFLRFKKKIKLVGRKLFYQLRQSADLNWLFLLKEALAELSAEGQQRDEDAEQQMRQKLYQDWVCRVWRAVRFDFVCVIYLQLSAVVVCLVSHWLSFMKSTAEISAVGFPTRPWQPCCQQVCWVALKLSETQMAQWLL